LAASITDEKEKEVNILNTIWTNPFTSTVGGAAAIATVLTALGVHVPGVDNGMLATGLITLLGLFARDGGK
jgi:hypothetical protein